MKRYKKIAYIILVVAVLFLTAMPVYATTPTWNYAFPITITDTSGVARTNLSVLTGISGITLNTSGYMASNGLDTNMQNGSSSIPYMMGTTQVPVFISSLPASGSVTTNLYTGYSPAQTTFPILVGNGGYITTADAAALEPADNFVFDISGYVDTSAPDKTLLWKKDAYYTGVSTSETITSAVLAAEANKESDTNTGSHEHFYGVDWYSQVWTAASSYVLTAVIVYSEANAGTPPVANGITIGLRNASGGLPVGSDLFSITLTSWTASSTNTFTLSNPYFITSGNQYAWVIRFPSGDVSNNIAFVTDGSGTGLCSSTDSGGTWVVVAGDKSMTFINKGDALTKSVSVGSITSGDRRIVTSDDTANIVLTVYDSEGTSLGTATTTSSSVLNNANNWIIGANNAMPYIEYYKETVSGTEVLKYQPATMVVGTTIPDRDTGDGTQNGTITWGSNSDITITFGEPASSSDTSYNSSTEFNGTEAPDATLPTSWYEGTISPNSPLYGMFTNAASTSGIPIGTLYFIVDITLVIALMLIAGVMTHSNLFMLIIGIAMIGISVNQGVIGGWAGVIFVIGTLSIVYLRRQM